MNRILYQQKGRIDPDSDTYKKIENLTLQKYFPVFYYEYKQNLQTIKELREQLDESAESKKAIEIENGQLKAEIESLKEQLGGVS